ncbi:MAG: phosphotransferase [Deltaproteobacteria bacterium]|nr:phosphotransferase [Deltaproteobacteria bacterium]
MAGINMKRLQKMDSLKSYELLQRVKRLAKTAAEVQETLENSFLREQVVEVVEGFYDLGRVVDAFEVFGGYNNRSFRVVVEQNGQVKEYFLRKYKLGIAEKEVLFEHAMIAHTIANGFDLLAGLIPCRDGSSFVSPSISKNKFALYHFLPGEDKYTWDNPLMGESEYKSTAHVLALFHNASKGLDHHDFGRVEPGILDLIDGMPQLFSSYIIPDRNSKFHDYYTAVLDSILLLIKANDLSETDTEQMVLNPIHSDYHPGNLKFEGGRVVGVFDLDWAKIDFRLFDVCLALIYNSVDWRGSNDGKMDLEKCRLFLKCYQDTLVEMKGLSPLNKVEMDNFPVMLAMANFYLLSWEISDYYSESEKNDYEYLAYFKHSVRQMHWIESHKKEFAMVADSARV